MSKALKLVVNNGEKPDWLMMALDCIEKALAKPVMSVKGIDGAWVSMIKAKIDVFYKLAGVHNEKGMHDVPDEF